MKIDDNCNKKWSFDINFSELKGKILQKVEYEKDQECIDFIVNNKEGYRLFHFQSCCESVIVEDICGNLDDLVGNPILVAEERINDNEEALGDERWTFYEIATLKGSVTIRFHGMSNGYYSVSVTFGKWNL